MGSAAENQVTVLVVEDHDDSRQMMKIMLELDGFRVFTAATGREAVERMNTTEPDLVLMDLNLPDVDGLTVTRRIRQLSGGRKPKIIALTAYDTSDSRDRARAAGCDEFLLKPVSFERLEAVACRLLADRSDRKSGSFLSGASLSKTLTTEQTARRDPPEFSH